MILYHHRPDLARRLADDLQGKNPFSDAANGLFLAAPRRTGKSKFLQFDLQPELESRGCWVVYVDFWAQSRRDPAEVLIEALATQVHSRQGLAGQLASAFSQIELAGVEIDLSRVGQPDGSSIAKVLQLLSQEARRQIVLILDEAQHTLTTEAGESAMFALKSARDQLNAPDTQRLLRVCCGSDRDQLLRLVNSANAPFYGSQIHHLPELDRSDIERLGAAREKVHDWLAPVDIDRLFEAFKAVGLRPQFLQHVLQEVLQRPTTDSVQAGNDIIAGARKVQQEEINSRRQLFLGLKPLEQYVLWRMLEHGAAFRPYDAGARQFYSALLGRKVSTPMAQAALESPRNHTPSVVWKSSPGSVRR